MALFRDLGTVKSYRKMEGFGVNTYRWVIAKGEAIYVKYHWKPKAGAETIDRHEAARLAGEDPDVASVGGHTLRMPGYPTFGEDTQA